MQYSLAMTRQQTRQTHQKQQSRATHTQYPETLAPAPVLPLFAEQELTGLADRQAVEKNTHFILRQHERRSIGDTYLSLGSPASTRPSIPNQVPATNSAQEQQRRN